MNPYGFSENKIRQIYKEVNTITGGQYPYETFAQIITRHHISNTQETLSAFNRMTKECRKSQRIRNKHERFKKKSNNISRIRRKKTIMD